MQLYIKEMPYFDPFLLVANLPEDKDLVFFDSAMQINENGRYSYIAYDPYSTIIGSDHSVKVDNQISLQTPVEILKNFLNDNYVQDAALPFCNGLAGYFGYEFVNQLEPKIKLNKKRELPDFILGAFDLVVGFDHFEKKCWIFSSGLPERDVSLRRVKARERSAHMQKLIAQVPNTLRNYAHSYVDTIDIKSNISFDKYCRGITRVLEYIHAGDIYQANISQQFSCTLQHAADPMKIYAELRRNNPAPFAAYLRLNAITIASASPERFIRVLDRDIISCPIKGTAARDKNSKIDQDNAIELSQCEKNRAENLMIVDLIRNDLSRVAALNSVKVPKLWALESYPTVHHLVSTVQAKLKKESSLIDVLLACFPGGSITGAPKKRAIEIIDEIETTARGPYCGNIGFLGYNGAMDSSIVIRTMVIKDRQLSFHVGGGIVADSTPEAEYIETLIKANALHKALTGHNIDFDLHVS